MSDLKVGETIRIRKPVIFTLPNGDLMDCFGRVCSREAFVRISQEESAKGRREARIAALEDSKKGT